MTKHELVANGQLVYGDVTIREKHEMLSLTDMWKAAGSDEAKRPSEWLRHDTTKEFVEVVSAANMGQAHIQTRRGANGGADFIAHMDAS